MLKKLLALTLALLFLLSLVACSKKKKPTSSDDDDKDEETSETDEKDDENKDDEEDKDDDKDDDKDKDDEDKDDDKDKKPAASQQGTFASAVLVDEKDIKITANGLGKEGYFGPKLNLTLENNTSSTLKFDAETVSVNGYVISPWLYESVNPGTKVEAELELDKEELALAKITTLDTISIVFVVENTADYSTYFRSETITLKSSTATDAAPAFDKSGTKLYDENGVTIIAKGLLGSDSIYTERVLFYIENQTAKPIAITYTGEATVNGKAIDPTFYTSVPEKCVALECVGFDKDDFNQASITKVESLTITFNIHDPETYESFFETPALTVNF